jgi:hypothetical protein
MKSRVILCCSALLTGGCATANTKVVHHYTFLGQDRERIAQDTAFLRTKALEGAQVAYRWRQLEPQKDRYDFSAVREDLALLASHGKRLFVQIQDVTFSAARTGVPEYLTREPEYHGGVDPQFANDDTTGARVAGWIARRWDPAVQARLHGLFAALGREFDGRIEGINLAETAASYGESPRRHPAGFSPEIYRDAIIANMRALKQAFPNSVVIQFANFMPGEWRPAEDKGYLRAVYDAARESKVGVGGPDLLPFRPGQLGSSYPLIREVAGSVPVGVAVQDGNFADRHPMTGQPITLRELLDFATGYLDVDYIFWGTEEPYYSELVVPYLRRSTGTTLSRGLR